MKVIAAYLLALLGGKVPSQEDIKGILSSVGADVDDERLSLFYELVEGKDLNELIQLGSQKLVSGGGGGGGAVVASSSAGGAAGGSSAGGAAPAEEKKEEKKEEKEESDDDMGFSLFD